MLLKSQNKDSKGSFSYSRLRRVIINTDNYNVFLDRYDGNYNVELYGDPNQYPIIIGTKYNCEHEVSTLEGEMLEFYDMLLDLPIDMALDQERANELWNKRFFGGNENA